MPSRPNGGFEVLTEPVDLLGEAPFWSVAENALYWIDLRAPTLNRFDPATGRRHSWAMPDLIGCFALTQNGSAIVGLKSGFWLFEFGSGSLTSLATPEPNLPRNRLNDGRCDPAGRFWAGTMQDGGGPPAGSLYRLDSDGHCKKMLSDLVIPNGIAWSPDGRTFYVADSARNVILKFPFDADEGILGRAELFASTAGHTGLPDGAAVDEDGCLWSAEYRGGRIVRYDPLGRIDRIITLPVTLTTACTFGGSDLGTLYVTSARQSLREADIALQPLAGAVFAIRLGVRGLPDRLFQTRDSNA